MCIRKYSSLKHQCQSRVNILYNALWEVAVPKGGNSTIHYSKKWLVSNIKLCYLSLGVDSTVVKTSDHAIYEIRNIIIEVANLADIIKELGSRVGSRSQTILETEHYELISLLHIWASLRETDSSAIF